MPKPGGFATEGFIHDTTRMEIFMDVSTCTTPRQLSDGLAALQEGTAAVCAPITARIENAILDMLSARAAAGARVLLVCPDGIRASEYGKAAARMDPAPAVEVTTVRELALGILRDGRAYELCGREARVLDGNEKDVLVEDVKVTGVKPRRLREMLKFFYNSMANCTDDAPTWIASEEEQRVYGVLLENLEARRAVLDCELSAMAGKVLAGLGAAGAAYGADVVVADACNLMSATSQKLVRALSQGLFIAIGSKDKVAGADEPYPDLEGFSALKGECDAVFELEGGRPSIAATLRRAKTPAGEFESVADALAEMVGAGEEPGGIAVGVPNKLWAVKIEAEIRARGIAVRCDMGPAKVPGDPRDPQKCAAIATRAFCKLVQDPDDLTALRTWIGLGEWLLCSEAFLEVLAWARTHGTDALSALRHLHAHPGEAAEMVLFSKVETALAALDELRAAWESGKKADMERAFAAHHIELAGHAAELFDEAGAQLGEDARRRIAAAVLDADAGGEVHAADAAGAQKAGPAENGAVLVAPYRRCIGRSCAHLFLTGMVNGFMPSLRAVDDRYSIDERAKARVREEAVFDVLKATPQKSLELSLFTEDLLDNAGKLGMETTRIFAKDGARRAYIAPSLFVEEIEAPQPASRAAH